MKDSVKLGAAVIVGAGLIAWLKKKAKSITGIGLIGSRTFKYRQDPHNPMARRLRIYAYEPYFDKDVWVGVIDYDKKIIRPTHGYFYPHKYGKLMKKIAETEGFVFNNN